jgi:hypothetical protein
MSQIPRDPRYTDPTTGVQTWTTAAYSASARTSTQASQSSRLNISNRPTIPSIAASWSNFPVRQSQTTSRGRSRGFSQSQGRGRGRGQSRTREYSQPFTAQSQTAATETNISDDYSTGYGPTLQTGDDFTNTAQSPAPTLNSGDPFRLDILDPRFVQDVRGADDGPERFGYDRESSSGLMHRLELQGDPVVAESQWTRPDNSDSNFLGEPTSNRNLGNEVNICKHMHVVRRGK